MLEDETVHTGTHKSRVYCSLPWKKVSSCGYLDSGRWSVRSTMLNCTTCHILKTVPGHAGLPQQCLWATVDTGPSFPAAQLSFTCGWLRSAKWKVWVGKRCEVEAKRKRRCSDNQSLSGQEAGTSGHRQWSMKDLSPRLWASPALPRGATAAHS